MYENSSSSITWPCLTPLNYSTLYSVRGMIMMMMTMTAMMRTEEM